MKKKENHPIFVSKKYEENYIDLLLKKGIELCSDQR